MTRTEIHDEFWFVERFTEKIKRLIPTRQQIHDSFAWEREYTYIPLPSLLAEDVAEAERTKEQPPHRSDGRRDAT